MPRESLRRLPPGPACTRCFHQPVNRMPSPGCMGIWVSTSQNLPSHTPPHLLIHWRNSHFPIWRNYGINRESQRARINCPLHWKRRKRGTPSHSAGDWSKELSLRTISHVDNSPALTAWANDTDFENVFVANYRLLLLRVMW